MASRPQTFMAVRFHKLRTPMFLLVFAGMVTQFFLSVVLAEKVPEEILAGVHRNFPPQYSVDESTGKPTGFAIEIMDEVARRAGLKVRYVIFDEWTLINRALREGHGSLRGYPVKDTVNTWG